jgi:tRNA dimethylallyltransferase
LCSSFRSCIVNDFAENLNSKVQNLHNPPSIILSGPTGVGKSDLAIELAQELSGEIVNLDSVQIYRGFEIGSAQPTHDQQRSIPHHLYSILDPDQLNDVALQRGRILECLSGIFERGNLPIMVGSSGMYLTSLINGLAVTPERSVKLRSRLERHENTHLHTALDLLDPVAAKRINLNDRKRMIRALEVALLGGGKNLSERFAQQQSEPENSDRLIHGIIILLLEERECIYSRINQRSAKMVKNGLISEVQGILERWGEDLWPLSAVGYREAVAFVKGGDFSLEAQLQLTEEIARSTRRYAKQQLTFWRNEPIKRGWQQVVLPQAAICELGFNSSVVDRIASSPTMISSVGMSAYYFSRSELIAVVRELIRLCHAGQEMSSDSDFGSKYSKIWLLPVVITSSDEQ